MPMIVALLTKQKQVVDGLAHISQNIKPVIDKMTDTKFNTVPGLRFPVPAKNNPFLGNMC